MKDIRIHYNSLHGGGVQRIINLINKADPDLRDYIEWVEDMNERMSSYINKEVLEV